MVKRRFWINMVEEMWQQKNVIWLYGVRRSGKTFLCKSLSDVEYFDCELPRVRRMMRDPESFLNSYANKRIVLDEIHRLDNPTEILKIAADHFLDIRIAATGSSTLGSSRKFRDTLTGRKRNLIMTPMNSLDLIDFENQDLNHRFLRGGLPPLFLSDFFPEPDFQEWMDSYWAKDIQELFRLEKKASFQKFVEILFVQSGGIFEATRFAAPCEISRQTVSNYLKVLEETMVFHVIRPFSSGSSSEIISAPKVYAFDTGFFSYHKGWMKLRNDDYGQLWEHYILNEIISRLQTRSVLYWRNKQGHEIDFVIKIRGESPAIVECKWNADEFNPKNLKLFRKRYTGGENFVVAKNIDDPFIEKFNDLTVQFVNLEQLIEKLGFLKTF